MKNENENITALCRQIDAVLGRPVRTPQDFTHLSEHIFERTRQTVSTSTLKRLFDYVSAEGSLRRSTLDIIARYVGYHDWASFCRRDADVLIESNPLLTVSLLSDEVCEGDQLCVTWQPDRECYFRCTGLHEFVVERSRNSKLSEGDTFRCHLFVKGEPLYLEELRMQGADPVHYVCGRVDGINFSLVNSEKKN